MVYFDNYRSNTLAGSGNQFIFTSDNTPTVSRTLYKVFAGGEYRYSFLFTNTVDSTYADGSISRANQQPRVPWRLLGARVGITPQCSADEFCEPAVFYPLTFHGQPDVCVTPNMVFTSDPLTLTPRTDEYLCIELTFCGEEIPYHEESVIPSFVLHNGTWIPDKRHPFVGMVGCDRPVEQRIGFWGDSITQGSGTDINSYTHWSAVTARLLGERLSYWNLGLGYGRAADAATDGAWFSKAKHNDWVVVCFGVNDLMQGYDAAAIKQHLEHIVDSLHAVGVRVLLQTVPPFEYPEHTVPLWNDVNNYILHTLCQKADAVFNNITWLCSEKAHLPRYGGHPNAAGCRVWGEAIAPVLQQCLEEF